LHAVAIARGHHWHRLRHRHHRRRAAVAVARSAAIAVGCHIARIGGARVARHASGCTHGGAHRSGLRIRYGLALLRERVAATAAAACAKHHGCQCQDNQCSLHCSVVPEKGDTPFN
jgi:hypothetical protein